MCMKIVVVLVVVVQLSSVAIRIWIPIEVKKDAELLDENYSLLNFESYAQLHHYPSAEITTDFRYSICGSHVLHLFLLLSETKF